MAVSESGRRRPVVYAIAGNGAVTIAKFLAASVSGSATMFAEAVHSIADTLNQVLLYIGLRRSQKKADEEFEYGYGNELSFFALISACGIFFVGAGVTVMHGISELFSHHSVEVSFWVFAVLAFSLSVELYTFFVAAHQLQLAFPRLTWRERLDAADPSTLAVFLEDAVAVLGVLVAFVSIILAHFTGSVVYDAVGSMVIGLLLAIVAIILIVRNRTYLLGRSMPDEMQEEVIAILRSDPAIERVIDFKSSVLGVGAYRIKCEVEFNGGALLDKRQRKQAWEQYDVVKVDFEEFKKFVVEYVDRVPRLIGMHIDTLEARIRERYPQIRNIDIEIN